MTENAARILISEDELTKLARMVQGRERRKLVANVLETDAELATLELHPPKELSEEEIASRRESLVALKEVMSKAIGDLKLGDANLARQRLIRNVREVNGQSALPNSDAPMINGEKIEPSRSRLRRIHSDESATAEAPDSDDAVEAVEAKPIVKSSGVELPPIIVPKSRRYRDDFRTRRSGSSASRVKPTTKNGDKSYFFPADLDLRDPYIAAKLEEIRRLEAVFDEASWAYTNMQNSESRLVTMKARKNQIKKSKKGFSFPDYRLDFYATAEEEFKDSKLFPYKFYEKKRHDAQQELWQAMQEFTHRLLVRLHRRQELTVESGRPVSEYLDKGRSRTIANVFLFRVSLGFTTERHVIPNLPEPLAKDKALIKERNKWMKKIRPIARELGWAEDVGQGLSLDEIGLAPRETA